MPCRILGVSAFYHDSAACLLQDGEILAAAQEERFTRKKHDADFPTHAVDYCLREAEIMPGDLDFVAFYDKPILKFERILETYLAEVPRGFGMFLKGLPVWLRKKLHTPRALDRGLNGLYKKRYIFTEHHEAHAASAFFPSPFDEAAIVTMDGVGEWTTASIGIGRGKTIEMLKELRFPHSLGLLYSAFTYFCGFRVNSGEYKLMGLAPYGEPRFADVILDRLMDLKGDGSFRLDLDYFGYTATDRMTSPRLERLFDGPPRRAESDLTQREMDLAASIQKVTEEVMLRTVTYAQSITGAVNLTLAGGVALNCVANGRILREGPFDDVWIQPAAGDAGGALGAALFVWHQLLDKPRDSGSDDSQGGSLLGPAYGNDEVRSFLDSVGAAYHHFDREEDLVEEVAGCIAGGEVVGHVQGRMEYGPRALGNRSIIGDARSADMQQVMNLKIKFRESFRPFAPSVLRDHVHEYFDMRERERSPYMLIVAPVRERHWRGVESGVSGLDRLGQVRSTIPAVTHVDHSARVQTVDERNGRYHRLLERFYEMTGCPVIINTSFNVRGEPIVCSPEDAYRCFMVTEMDVLVIEDFLLRKEEQTRASKKETEVHLAKFDLD